MKFIIETNQLNFSVIVRSHHRADPKSIKINNTAEALVGVLGPDSVLYKTSILHTHIYAYVV
jgi:hypothetical protein